MQLSVENSDVLVLICDNFSIVSPDISQHWVAMVYNRKLLVRLIIFLLKSLFLDVE